MKDLGEKGREVKCGIGTFVFFEAANPRGALSVRKTKRARAVWVQRFRSGFENCLASRRAGNEPQVRHPEIGQPLELQGTPAFIGALSSSSYSKKPQEWH